MSELKKYVEPIICPICGAEMKKGKSIIKGTFLGILGIGFSYQPLWFNKEKVLTPNMAARAFRCYTCKATLVLDN